MMDAPQPKADARIDGPEGQSNFGALKERVRNIDLRLDALVLAIKETNLALKEATQTMGLLGKPKWTVWIGIGTLVVLVTGGMWNLAVAPISDRVHSLEGAIVPREVHIEKWAQIKEEMQRIDNEITQKASKDDLNRVIIDIDQRLKRK